MELALVLLFFVIGLVAIVYQNKIKSTTPRDKIEVGM